LFVDHLTVNVMRQEVIAATGLCRLLGNASLSVVESVSCRASDAKGAVYFLDFKGDGQPVSIKHF
jgi:hypothetical protein